MIPGNQSPHDDTVSDMPQAAIFPSLPDTMEPDLARLKAYWDDLKRGGNEMPFADDVDLSKVPLLAPHIILLNAFENPERFRFEFVGEQVESRYGSAPRGKFSDELAEHAPLEGLTAQCSATIARRAPTYYRSEATAKNAKAVTRLLLPTWGEGHIAMLLGAVA